MSQGIQVTHGDSREVLKGFPDNHFDSVVTDPPYALVTIVKRFANSPRNEKTENPATPHGRTGRGFMGQKWDTGETAFDPEFWREVFRVLKPGAHLAAFSGTRTYHRMTVGIEDAGFEIRDQIGWLYGSGFPKSHNQGNGWGTALKPAWEPICLARKPLSEKTVAANVLRWGTGAINIDGCRVETGENLNGGAYAKVGGRNESQSLHAGSGMNQPGKTTGKEFAPPTGRWPANVIHDGSDEVVALFPDSDGAQGVVRGTEQSETVDNGIYGRFARVASVPVRGDNGSAARFFYTAKADAEDRIGSKHPTVKPVDLMQWLMRLITPPGGLVLEPFAGSGTTGEAAFREGMRCVMIEREASFVADINRRISLLLAGPDERTRSAIKAKIADGRLKDDAGPLFAE